MQISDFDYELPPELIAQHPLPQRDASRMLVLDRGRQSFRDSSFSLLPELLQPSDVLVLNNTKVFPARLLGKRANSGGAAELLLLREVEPNVWDALARPARRMQKGVRLSFGENRLNAEVIEELAEGIRRIRFETTGNLPEIISEIGQTPLPPYIKRETGLASADRERYQTIYASTSGAIAAPTAGLHFTREVLDEIARREVQIAEITLHVGYGTFEPVRVNDVSQHRVAPEYFSISVEAATLINQARSKNGRVVCVGTTTARALEAAAAGDGNVAAQSSVAEITITPGYEFKAVNALLTNFHLPKSSLLLLVSAFAGREFVLEAYRHAVNQRYRFYSYGDCMLIT